MPAVVALVFTAHVVGCSSGNANEPTIGEIPAITDPAEVTLPLDAYESDPEENYDVQLAAWRLIEDCVARFDGTYTASKPTLDAMQLGPFATPNERRYGLADLDSATVHGYRVSPELLGSQTKVGGWSPSEEELVLVRGSTDRPRPVDLNGDPLPEGGCSAEANRLLGSGVSDNQAHISLPSLLGSEAHELAENDSRVQVALREWSECMSRSNFSYATVWDPNNRQWPTPIEDEEIATAVADVSCKHEVNLIGIWSAVETAYQTQVIHDHQAELDALLADRETEIANAALVLGDD